MIYTPIIFSRNPPPKESKHPNRQCMLYRHSPLRTQLPPRRSMYVLPPPQGNLFRKLKKDSRRGEMHALVQHSARRRHLRCLPLHLSPPPLQTRSLPLLLLVYPQTMLLDAPILIYPPTILVHAPPASTQRQRAGAGTEESGSGKGLARERGSCGDCMTICKGSRGSNFGGGLEAS